MLIDFLKRHDYIVLKAMLDAPLFEETPSRSRASFFAYHYLLKVPL
jgi:hypothetical protein